MSEKKYEKIDVRFDFLKRKIPLGAVIEFFGVLQKNKVLTQKNIMKEDVLEYLLINNNYYVKSKEIFINKFFNRYDLNYNLKENETLLSFVIKEMLSTLCISLETAKYLNLIFWNSIITSYINAIYENSKRSIRLKITEKTYTRLNLDNDKDCSNEKIADVVAHLIGIWLIAEEFSNANIYVTNNEGSIEIIVEIIIK